LRVWISYLKGWESPVDVVAVRVGDFAAAPVSQVWKVLRQLNVPRQRRSGVAQARISPLFWFDTFSRPLVFSVRCRALDS